jgi:hypothetical protein
LREKAQCLLYFGWRNFMENSALRRAGELAPSVREAFESVLGRHLDDNETVSIHAHHTRPAPRGKQREAAYRRLLEFGDKLAQRVKDVPEEEIDAAIREAVDYVRHHPE